MRDNELFRKDPPSLLSPEGLHGCASTEGLQKCSKLTVLAGKCIIKIITWIKTITWIKKTFLECGYEQVIGKNELKIANILIRISNSFISYLGDIS